LFIAVLAIVALLGVVLWRHQRKAVTAGKCEPDGAFDVHDQETAHALEKLQSGESRSTGWTGNGALWATLVVYGFGSMETDRLT
jgi:hypothetical protein